MCSVGGFNKGNYLYIIIFSYIFVMKSGNADFRVY